MLANVLTQIKHGGCVAACGLAGGAHLATAVILSIQVSIFLVLTQLCVQSEDAKRLGPDTKDIPSQAVGNITQIVGLEELPDLADKILAGQIAGRVVVDLAVKEGEKYGFSPT